MNENVFEQVSPMSGKKNFSKSAIRSKSATPKAIINTKQFRFVSKPKLYEKNDDCFYT